jgi:hypothetical protein
MIKLSPVVDDRLCIIYIAQTFARWHDGVARQDWADYWLQKYGNLTNQEISAAEILREILHPKGCVIIRESAKGNPELDDDIIKAFSVLTPYSERIYLDEKASLIQWADRIVNHPPDYFAQMWKGLDTFFGIKQDYDLRVYLLPSPTKSCCGNGDMFVEEGATTLGCSGMIDEEGVFLTLLHEAAHSVHQRIVLNSLVDEVLNTSYGQNILGMFRESPVGKLGGGLRSYLGELVIHSLVPHGALRELCGLPSSDDYWKSVIENAQKLIRTPITGWGDIYGVWVMNACAEMVPFGREYVAQQKQLDETFVYATLNAFERIYLRWQKES